MLGSWLVASVSCALRSVEEELATWLKLVAAFCSLLSVSRLSLPASSFLFQPAFSSSSLCVFTSLFVFPVFVWV